MKHFGDKVAYAVAAAVGFLVISYIMDVWQGITPSPVEDLMFKFVLFSVGMYLWEELLERLGVLSGKY